LQLVAPVFQLLEQATPRSESHCRGSTWYATIECGHANNSSRSSSIDDRYRLLALCALRIGGIGIDWGLLAREAQEPSGLDRLYHGEILEHSAEAREARPVLHQGLAGHLDAAHARVAAELDRAERAGARLVTVLDPDYPAILRQVANLPPFLFIIGTIRPDDALAVAVVGTRRPSETGLTRAAWLTKGMVERRVTIVSGLAKGIDTAAHQAAVASGGRTIAVLGQGIATPVSPRTNAALAEACGRAGAVISQFWPSAQPASWTFPRRNATTSGLAQGTLVVEANSHSGAKMTARLAIEQGRRVWLPDSLLAEQEWARGYLARGATPVSDVDEVLAWLAPADRVVAATRRRIAQLTLL
jgi:DNA processing protein